MFESWNRYIYFWSKDEFLIRNYYYLLLVSISLVIFHSFTKIFNKKSFILFYIYLQTILFQINLSFIANNYFFSLFVIFISDKSYSNLPLDEYFTVDETAIGVYGKFLTGKESSALVRARARIMPRNHNELRANTHRKLSMVSVKCYNCYQRNIWISQRNNNFSPVLSDISTGRHTRTFTHKCAALQLRC